MVEMNDAEFEELVADALDELPADIQEKLDNLVFLIEQEPSEEQLRDSEFDEHLHPHHAKGSDNPEGAELLGLYEGVAQTDGDLFGYAEPNRIFIFRGPTLRMCTSADEVAEEVMITVFHEVAHHFGIEEDALWDMGWA